MSAAAKAKAVKIIRVEGELVQVTHPDKILFPDLKLSKLDVIKYYHRVAPYLLAYLRNRMYTLKRYPSGITEEMFFEKQCPSHRPRWVETGEFGGVRYCLVNNLRTLMWISNLATIEMHATLGLIESPQRPTAIAFDLDPGEGTGVKECAQVALEIRNLLASHRLQSFAKTSGSKGIHVFVPLNGKASYERVTPFAKAVAEHLEQQFPETITSKMAKKLRPGKVFIDWSQNVDFKTTVCPYSLRATPYATVSTPLHWEELEEASQSKKAARALLMLDIHAVLKRLEQWGDLFAPVVSLKQVLPRQSVLEPPQKTLKFTKNV